MADRGTLRTAFAALLGQLVGDGQLLQRVYRYKPNNPKGQTILAAIGSVGTEARGLTFRNQAADHVLELWTMALYAEIDAGGKLVLGVDGVPVWDEEDSLDALDQLAEQIANLIRDNQTRHEQWKAIEWAGPSEISVQSIAGTDYQMERTPLRFKVY